MYKVMLTDKREALVDADDFSFSEQDFVKLFKDGAIVAMFERLYVIGVYQPDLPYLFITNEKML